MTERYSRQVAFGYIGEEGQKRLRAASAVIVGCGALGSAAAEFLARAGVGRLRIIDADRVELSNLQRQSLFSSWDVGAYKVGAAAGALHAINPETAVEAVNARLTAENAGELLSGAGVVIDAVDNLESRFAVNRWCVESGMPWIYGGVAGAEGMTMNMLPGGPCFRCLMPGSIPEQVRTAETDGILATTAAFIASVQCTEAMKILVHGASDSAVRRTLLYVNLLNNTFEQRAVARLPGCEACGGGRHGE